jgi:Domain of unknown function (DUF4440)
MEVLMKGYVCLFLFAVVTAVVAQSNGSTDEAAVLNVQQQWLDASQKGNADILRQIIDDSFVGNTPDSQIIDKQSLFPPKGSQPIFVDTHFVGLSARVIGDTAVVFGAMVTTGDRTTLRCVMVYAKRAGVWKMIAAQLVPVPETKDGERH